MRLKYCGRCCQMTNHKDDACCKCNSKRWLLVQEGIKSQRVENYLTAGPQQWSRSLNYAKRFVHKDEADSKLRQLNRDFPPTQRDHVFKVIETI